MANSIPTWEDLLGPYLNKYSNPSRYASSIANMQFDPILRGLDMQRSRSSLLRAQSNKAIADAYAPALAQYKAQTSQDAAAALNAQKGIQAMAGQLANAVGSSGNNAGLANTAGNYAGLVGAQAATRATQDNAGLTQAQQRVAQLQANRQGELTSKMMDIDRALVDARRQKADAYTKAFTGGLGMRNQLIGGALANRSAMINQDVLQQMAPVQLEGAKLANKQAKQNLFWQNIQGQQGVEMNNLQMAAMRKQMNQAGIGTSFFNLPPDQKAQLTQSLIGQFIDPNTGGWTRGRSSSQIANAMFNQLKNWFPGSARKHPAKLKAYIADMVNAQMGSQGSGYDPSTGGVEDPGIGGSYSPPGYPGSGSSGGGGGGGW